MRNKGFGSMGNNELLAKLDGFAKVLNVDAKSSAGVEAQRAEVVKECHKRGLVGMPSKRKWRIR